MATILSVALENHPGSLSEILDILSGAQINVDAIEAEAMGDFGTVRLLTSKPKFAADLLRQDGYDVVEAEVLELIVANRHGELGEIMARLAENGVNVVSLFGTVTPESSKARLLLRVNDVKRAKALLGVKA